MQLPGPYSSTLPTKFLKFNQSTNVLTHGSCRRGGGGGGGGGVVVVVIVVVDKKYRSVHKPPDSFNLA